MQYAVHNLVIKAYQQRRIGVGEVVCGDYVGILPEILGEVVPLEMIKLQKLFFYFNVLFHELFSVICDRCDAFYILLCK